MRTADSFLPRGGKKMGAPPRAGGSPDELSPKSEVGMVAAEEARLPLCPAPTGRHNPAQGQRRRSAALGRADKATKPCKCGTMPGAGGPRCLALSALRPSGLSPRLRSFVAGPGLGPRLIQEGARTACPRVDGAENLFLLADRLSALLPLAISNPNSEIEAAPLPFVPSDASEFGVNRSTALYGVTVR